LSKGNGVQVIGKVNPDLSIKALSTLDLGTEVGEFWSKTLILFPLSSSIIFQLFLFSLCLSVWRVYGMDA